MYVLIQRSALNDRSEVAFVAGRINSSWNNLQAVFRSIHWAADRVNSAVLIPLTDGTGTSSCAAE